MSSENQGSFSREEDREFFERELAAFAPDRVFDAHCHLCTPEAAKHAPTQRADLRHAIGYEEYHRMMECVHPGRRLASLFIPMAWAANDL